MLGLSTENRRFIHGELKFTLCPECDTINYMEFVTIKPEDKDTINKCLNGNPGRICEYTFGTMYIWSVHDEYCFCVEDDVLYFGVIDQTNADFYFPVGNVAEKDIRKLENYCKENNLEFRFSFVSSSQAEFLKGIYGDRIELEYERDWDDYLYYYDDLLYLRGKKYHGQKNHINRFLKEYPDFEMLPFDVSMTKEAVAFLDEYYATLGKDNQWLRDERYILENKLFRYYPIIDQEGLVIKINGKIAAMAFGEAVGDTLYVHFEKASRDYNGIYAAINQKFLEYCRREGIKYVNREEDLGDLGLRTAKTSLHPCEMIPKYFAKVNI